jgi:alpha-amylase/alpha-mannosidase (GH57 family)
MRYPLNIAFIWHMHQPLYKDNLSKTYLMPWVRLHAIKDYLDMAVLLEKFPNISQTFNMVPSLIEQIQDYANRDAEDLYLRLSSIPVENLSLIQKGKILELFFDLNWEKMISKFPRYLEILKKRESLRKVFDDDYEKIAKEFDDQEILDLTVLFNLAWFDYIWQNYESDLIYIINKGENFSYQDRDIVLNKQFKVIEKIIPEYIKLEKQGKIEITTSPYYHPILPLLCNSDSAQVAREDLTLPSHKYSYSIDATNQLKKGIKKHNDVFGKLPKGLWPSEQSVSPEMASLIPQEINWMVSDEGILFNSLNYFPSRDSNRILNEPEILYQPYLYQAEGRNITMVFRDIYLSDAIGFMYSKMNYLDAARDFYSTLKEIQNRLSDDKPYLITIALDGENCWEHYDNDGYDFLNALYTLISQDSSLNMTTVSNHLEKHPPQVNIDNLFSGSWIRSDFTTWIGDPVKNDAWDCLYEARKKLSEYQQNNPQDVQLVSQAWEEIYIAEGSDWFWWYGDGNSSSHDDLFDMKFRTHIKNVYKLIGLKAPDNLNNSLYQDSPSTQKIPQDVIKEGWLDCGIYYFGNNTGTMHQSGTVFDKIYYGHDKDNLRLKIFYSLFFTLSEKDYFEIYIQTHKYNIQDEIFKISDSASIDMIPDYKIVFNSSGFSDIYKMNKNTDSWEKTTSFKNVTMNKVFAEVVIPYRIKGSGENKFVFVIAAYKDNKLEELTERIDYFMH